MDDDYKEIHVSPVVPKETIIANNRKGKSSYINFVNLKWTYLRITNERENYNNTHGEVQTQPHQKSMTRFQTLQWYFSPSSFKNSWKFSLDSSFQVPKKGSTMMDSLLRRGTHIQKPRNMGNPVLPTSSFTRHPRHVTSGMANGQQQDRALA